MLRSILVIDNGFDHPERAAAYTKLAQHLKGSASLLSLELIFVKAENDILRLTRDSKVVGVLLDVFLGSKADQEHDWQISLEQVLSICEKLPVALISKYWDAATSFGVTRAFEQANVRAFVTFREMKNSPQPVALMLQKMVADAQELVLEKFGADGEINVLHIADLQIGNLSEREMDRFLGEIHRVSDAVIEKCNGAPDLLVLSGDVAERGLPHEFELAAEIIQQLVDPFGANWKFPTRRIALCPGNHDVCMNLAGSSRVSLGAKTASGRLHFLDEMGERLEYLNELALYPYRRFEEKVTGRRATVISEETAVFAWVEKSFRHRGAAMWGLKTVGKISAFDFPGRALNHKELRSIEDQFRTDSMFCSEDFLMIGVCHHSPFSGHSDRSVENPELAVNFFAGPALPDVLFHGHWHEYSCEVQAIGSDSRRRRLVTCAAPALGVKSSSRPEDTLRGFVLLKGKIEKSERHLTFQRVEWGTGGLVDSAPISFRAKKRGQYIELD